MIRFTNTLTGKKEELIVKNGIISMYICGVTPYADAHVGHGRCYVAFDLLYRALEFFGYTVRYCRNFTDIDDKLLRCAYNEFGDRLRYHEIADRYMRSFGTDMIALNCKKPTYEPRVTAHIKEIIVFIQMLIDKGYAYQSSGDVYFHIAQFPDYGKLSKQKVKDLCAGVRIDVREQKKDPLDFALWKGEPAGEFWESPWGPGRPGWHIECSALASLFLGEHLTLHGGGLDLIFPHHENEIAQSESLFGAPFAHLWLHNGLVNSGTEKMSKSLGNILSLDELFKKIDPMVVRYYFLTHHYRAPIDFSYEGLESAQKSYDRLCRVFGEYGNAHIQTSLSQSMCEFLRDDLNTSGLLGVVFENMQNILQDAKELDAIAYILKQVLGLTLTPLAQPIVEITPEIQKIIDEREIARHEKDWGHADELRKQLEDRGVDVRDEKIR